MTILALEPWNISRLKSSKENFERNFQGMKNEVRKQMAGVPRMNNLLDIHSAPMQLYFKSGYSYWWSEEAQLQKQHFRLGPRFWHSV